MEKFFGTDGVRGVANRDLTPELAMYIGQAAAFYLAKQAGLREGTRAKIIIGRDTRVSGGMLEAALAAGICSMGVDVWLAGVVPTPAVAYLTKTFEACAGVVISASHNPAPDNGIKFFSNLGYKFPDEVEDEIEALIHKGLTTGVVAQGERPVGSGVGRVVTMKQAEERYVEFLKGAAPSLQGLTVVVDCANGAAGAIAPKLFAELGACVIPVFDSADGMSINVMCGSTHPENLAQKVLACHADLGLAFDGDADRVIAVDENGQIVDGDAIMLICALSLKERHSLKKDTLVLTVMSNLGLRRALRENGIQIEETAVGDRYVLERLIASGAVLGGEQSGHIIFTDHALTGDGILSALKLMEVIQVKQKRLSELTTGFTQYPQVIQNTHVKDKYELMNHPDVLTAIAEAKERLGADGRVLVRPSGTEPMIRVMLEGPDKAELEAIAQDVIDQIDSADG
ncbi:MAG: phosphoglucosamine mutase [Peptococcaceae bacterium]|nr:phosphoglucosamine mutase [Peptococcaceae bacterium]MDR2736734.1 phosphoglucosamine mutase [Gracilibacteraceae bacterium]